MRIFKSTTTHASLRDWATLPASALKALRLEPAERLNITGHKYPLGVLWRRTVGGWCVGDTNYFLGPGGVVEHVARRTFDVYKYRHQLRTGPQFHRIYADTPWSLPEAVFDSFEQHQLQHGGLSGYGRLAAAVGLTIGVLPIEAVLYVILFSEFLGHNGLKRMDWGELDDTTKQHLWGQGRGPRSSWNITTIYTRDYVDPYGEP